MTDEREPSLSLADAAALFLSGLPPQERDESQQELGKFVRWFGRDRPIRELAAYEIEKYAERVAISDLEPTRRLEPVRAFLSHAKRERLTPTNLSVHLRVKRASPKKRAPVRPSWQVIALTSEGYAELETELDSLKRERPRIAEELRKAAQDKDFAENAPLDAAKEYQGQVEARIRGLEETLKQAIIIKDEAVDTNMAGLGSTVTLRDLSSGEVVCYTLVNPSEASPLNGKISIASPTGKVLLNRVRAEEVEVTAPGGTLRYLIEGIKR